MTIEVNDRRKEYDGNGTTKVFAGPRVLNASHLAVYIANDITGESSLQEDGYTLTGVGKAATTVTFDEAPPEGRTVLLLRTVPFEQALDISNQGAYLPEVIEESGFDALAMQIQQLVDRMLRVIIGDETAVGDAWNFDAQGRRIINLADGVGENDAINLSQMQTYIETIVANGMSIEPAKFEFTGDGVTTDFPIPGADVESALFYDTAIEGVVMEPYDDFTIILGETPEDTILRFTVPPANAAEGFTIMRAFASPYVNENSEGRVPIFLLEETALTVDNTHERGLVCADNAGAITLTIHEDDGTDTDFGLGSYFSAMQVGAGAVTIAAELAATIVVPDGFLPSTRGPGAIITATRKGEDAWVLSGDLLRESVTPALQTFAFPASDLTTDLTTGTSKANLILPYGFLLADDGVRASLRVAQPSGVLLTLDLNVNGVSILATKLTFDNTERSTATAAAPFAFETGGEVLSAGDEITVDIDQVGDVGAQGLMIYLTGQRAS